MNYSNSRDNTPSRGVIPQSSSTTVDEYYYKLSKLAIYTPIDVQILKVQSRFDNF